MTSPKQSPSTKCVGGFKLRCIRTGEFQIFVSHNKGGLVEGDLFWRFAQEQLTSSCGEFLRSEVHERILLGHVEHQVI